MKIIITGSTGWVGNAVLNQCLSTPAVTSIVSISRRDPGNRDPKLTTILYEDFSNYPDHIIEEFKFANAFIYCLGTNIPIKPAELNRKINFDYALVAACAFAKATKNKASVRFVYLSGALVEKDPNKRLWILEENRKMRGELENALLKLDQETAETGMRIYIARPGFVQPPGAMFKMWIIDTITNAIFRDDLAAAMVQLALNGGSWPLVENDELKSIAKAARAILEQ
jgi:nucleoside-diphosphate-sugar epimerase